MFLTLLIGMFTIICLYVILQTLGITVSILIHRYDPTWPTIFFRKNNYDSPPIYDIQFLGIGFTTALFLVFLFLTIGVFGELALNFFS